MLTKTKATWTVLIAALLAQAFARDRKVVMDRALLHDRVESLVSPGSAGADRAAARAALEAFGAADPDRLAEALVPAIGAGAIAHGVALLASLESERVAPALIDLATTHPAPPVRISAIHALVGRQELRALPALYLVADEDAALVVRQEAVVALAALGDDAVLCDLTALLDPLTAPALRARATEILLGFTDQPFDDRASANAWIETHTRQRSRTSVGLARDDEEVLVPAPAPGVCVLLLEDRIELRIDGTPRPGNLVLDHPGGSVLVEVRIVEGVAIANALDVPDRGVVFERHKVLPIQEGAGPWSICLPRTGQLQRGAIRVDWVDWSDGAELASGR